MGRLIDADKLLEPVGSYDPKKYTWEYGMVVTVEDIKKAPTIDAELVVHAHWEKVYGYVTPGGDPVWACSNCGKGEHIFGVEAMTYNRDISDNHQWVACPNCGAKMDCE